MCELRSVVSKARRKGAYGHLSATHHTLTCTQLAPFLHRHATVPTSQYSSYP